MPTDAHQLQWFGTGRAWLDAMLAGIEGAHREICLEVYIFSSDATGRRFRDALQKAAARGVKVSLLVDAFGSLATDDHFFAPYCRAAGRFKRFNARRLGRLALRDHRKLLIVDGQQAFVGGCNLADEYHGDGVTTGWRDGGVSVLGPLAAVLREEFASQWTRAEAARWDLPPGGYGRLVGTDDRLGVLCMKPGLGPSALRTALRRDLARAKNILITTAYFLPSLRLLRQLKHADRRGARVQLLLAGPSDVPLMALAGRSLYRGLLGAGVEIYEYQPQVLHAKCMVLDNVVYTGSSNLDPRSLRLNFEIMLRIEDAALAAAATAQFATDLTHSRAITPANSWQQWSAWTRLQQRFARFVLARLDPWFAREQLRRM
jgi:cardiolipin synthase A/B